MPCLNRDYLYDIGKQLIEEGDSDAVYRFGLSGTEPWKAVANVFSTVTFVELHRNYYCIGWNGNCCCTFRFRGNYPHSKFLTNCVGAFVKDLKIIGFSETFYTRLLNTINDKKQLISFYGRPSYNSTKILKIHSKTLKHVSIPSQLMTKELQNLLHLNTLTFIDFDNRITESLENCCKTVSLTMPSKAILRIDDTPKNPHLWSIKTLTFDCDGSEKWGFKYYLDDFPSCKHIFLKCEDFKFTNYKHLESYIFELTIYCHMVLNLSSSLTMFCSGVKERTNFESLVECFNGFERNNSDPKYYGFKKTITTTNFYDCVFKCFISK